MINSVILTGRFTADPELKTTSSGISVTSFSVAVNRPKRKDEEQQADFITVVAWRQTAELITKHFRKGNLIGIEGAIQTRKYEDRDGNRRTAFEVLAERVHFLEAKREQSTSNEPSTEPQNDTSDSDGFAALDSDDLPF